MGRKKITRSYKETQKFKLKLQQRNYKNQKFARLKKKKRKNIPKTISERIRKCRDKKKNKYSSNTENSEQYLGSMNFSCQHCDAKHFAEEILVTGGTSFNDCCSHGAISAPSFEHFPNELRNLFEYTHQYSAEFINDIRRYNTSLSFASFNANLVNFRGRRPGPYCFKVQGQIYYQINTALYPETDRIPNYGQLFILDPSEANRHRMEVIDGLNPNLLESLDKIIRNNNIFAKSYQMMKDKIKRLERKVRKFGGSVPEVKMSFILKPGKHKGRYNLPKTQEVAAVFTTTADGDIPDSYVAITNNSTSELKYVSSMDPKVEPWVYPLFYPCGNLGWHKNILRSNKSRRVTRQAYTKNLMAIRDTFSPIHSGGRLSQQWYVDSYIKIERDRIEYCRSHQKELHADSYQGVIDNMERKAKKINGKIGKMIILPSTFIGSPRYMAQTYQDAMAIVRKYGKPDIFLTMTCNPNWREIQENLKVGQQPCDRPELVARVFNAKKKVLLREILKGNHFGKVEAYVYVIEFQKRGLPHMHLLITLTRNYKITSPDLVDDIISAEIPDEEKDPELYRIVMQNMIHGPCGNWCSKDGKCSYHFPKPFNPVTTMDKDGYPCYRRRNTEKYHNRPNGYVVDDRFVVPYCPSLLRRFNCHMNVEVVSSIKSIKYLFKYIYKGYDAATINIQGTASNLTEIIHDEINEHIDARYVGPVEACWRILSFKLQEKSHAIIRMPVHLPYQHNVTINPGAEDVDLNTIIEQKKMLLDYFALNIRDEEAKKYVYPEIPTHYTFTKGKSNDKWSWIKRKKQFKTIGRMYSVSPTQLELFHLRLLLLTVKGAQNFEDLRTVDGHLYACFTDACIARGLIADDDEWKRAMHEAEIWMMPQQLRRLYVRILIHCQPLHPENLWNEFKTAMSEDFGNNAPIAEMKALQQINDYLQEEDKHITDFPSLPLIKNILHDIIDEEYYENILQTGLEYYNMLNSDQKQIVDLIIDSVEANDNIESKCFYIDGPGGSGKTFIYTTLWHLLWGRKVKVSTMAFTGIAATLLPRGRTVHKTFGLTVPLYSDSTSSIKRNSKEARNLLETKIFIWDEAPMAPRYALEVIDRTLRDFLSNDLPFGGKTILLGGDFRQLLPVNQRGIRSETVNLSIKYSPLWKFFKIFHLTKNMRTLPQEIEFSRFLLQVGDGVLNDEDDNLNLPNSCVNFEDIDIATDIYGDLISARKYKDAAKCAILAARNIDVDEINKKVVELLDIDTEKIYTSVDNADNCNENDEIKLDLVPEYLNTLAPTSLPPHELRLRKFCIVMLIRNLNISEGLCNGTRLLVLELRTNVLRCEILTGDKAGEIVFLNRITFICENVYPFTFMRRQFPIKLAFAITINKAQGQTFKRIGIDLRKDVFNHGQLYVALSRVQSWESLTIYLGSKRNNTIVKNYVYKELYQ